MIRTGILNPGINSLLSRVRHTNTLVLADRNLRIRPQMETIDIGLVAGMPGIVDVLTTIRANLTMGRSCRPRSS